MVLSLIAELKRRRVFRAPVGYGIAAFAVLQIAISVWVALVLLCLGPEARALEIISSLPIENDIALLSSFWGPDGRAARRATGFAEFARKIGFADLWERYGPPDGCHRVAPCDYACN